MLFLYVLEFSIFSIQEPDHMWVDFIRLPTVQASEVIQAKVNDWGPTHECRFVDFIGLGFLLEADLIDPL